MSKESRDILVWLGGYYLAVAAIIFISMAFFVRGLGYDYTTTSSILFTVVLAFLSLGILVSAVSEWRTEGPIEPLAAVFIVLFLFVFLLLAMAAVTASLGIFTAIYPQKPAKIFDMVSTFWGVMAWPFVQIGALLGNLVPSLEALFKMIGRFYDDVLKPIERDSPILSNTISGLLSTTLAGLLVRGRLAQARKT